MKTIYVKRNFPLILAGTGSVISLLYLIDHFYFNGVNSIPEDLLFLINPSIKANNTTRVSTMIVKGTEEAHGSLLQCSVTVALILCEANQYLSLKTKKGRNQSESQHPAQSRGPSIPIAKDFARQINQTLVMLKSIAIQTLYDPGIGSDCVNVIVLSDRKEHFENIREKIRIDWDVKFQRTLRLTHVPVKYPPGSGWMKKMFRPCATLRLFIPELLPKEYESIIYLDTDFIFLRSVQFLQKAYLGVSKGQRRGQDKIKNNGSIAGMAPCLFHYGTTTNLVPYYGSSGLNAGLMLMNLRGMRESLWTNKIRMVTAMFQHEIKLADQDILNIYFHFFPEQLTPLTCDWNFRSFQCREGSYCEDPSLAGGISALHGNALSFTPQGPEPLFHVVFSAFQEAKLDSQFSLETFVEDLETRLLKAEETFHSDCVRYGGFTVMVLNRLDKLVRLVDLEDRDMSVGGTVNLTEDFDFKDYSFYNSLD